MNLGLQCVGLMHGKMNDEDEAAILHCNNMSQFRQAAEKKPNLIPAIHIAITCLDIACYKGWSYMEKGFKFSLQLVRMR